MQDQWADRHFEEQCQSLEQQARSLERASWEAAVTAQREDRQAKVQQVGDWQAQSWQEKARQAQAWQAQAWQEEEAQAQDRRAQAWQEEETQDQRAKVQQEENAFLKSQNTRSGAVDHDAYGDANFGITNYHAGNSTRWCDKGGGWPDSGQFLNVELHEDPSVESVTSIHTHTPSTHELSAHTPSTHELSAHNHPTHQVDYERYGGTHTDEQALAKVRALEAAQAEQEELEAVQAVQAVEAVQAVAAVAQPSKESTQQALERMRKRFNLKTPRENH
jgi:hypothetical protein